MLRCSISTEASTTTTTKLIQIDIEMNLAGECSQLLSEAELLCALLGCQVIHRFDFSSLPSDGGRDFYVRHIAIINTTRSRFNPSSRQVKVPVQRG